MAKLILLRHLKSQWNLENRFTGWVDVPLAKAGLKEAREISKKVFKFKIDKIYSSPLFRNQATVLEILNYRSKYPIFIHLDKGKMNAWGHFEEINKNYYPIYISENLNERYYGSLQGLNKEETRKKYGKEKVHLWRRGYRNVPPGGESLEGTYKRSAPFYKKYIEKDLKSGKNALIVGSHNALRSIIKHIEKVSDKDISKIEVPYGGLIKYEFDRLLRLKNKKIL